MQAIQSCHNDCSCGVKLGQTVTAPVSSTHTSIPSTKPTSTNPLRNPTAAIEKHKTQTASPSASKPSSSSSIYDANGDIPAKLSAAPPSFKRSTAPYLSDVEANMVDEINLVRSNPRGYVKHISTYIQDQKKMGGGMSMPGMESMSAVAAELIKELNGMAPLNKLQPKECVFQSAKLHGEDMKQRGKTGHTGSDGTMPWDRVKRDCKSLETGKENLVGGGMGNVRESVIMLLLDRGISTRGHRKTMLDPTWKYAACYRVGKVGIMPNNWVQVYAK